MLLSSALQLWLVRRQVNSVQQHKPKVPDAFAEKITLEEHQKAADYTTAKANLGTKEFLFSTTLLFIWTLGGGLEFLDQAWRAAEWSELWTGVAVILSLTFIGQILDLPLGLYRTFRLEAKFGFNRTTLGLFFTDMVKGLAIGLAIGIPFMTLILWLMGHAGTYWWLMVWVIWMGFNVFIMWAYPAFIAPLFNKFVPLEEGELKQRVEELLSNNGFASQGIFVIDGSKRSGHGNAYFAGIGKNKRIVFFDTLLEGLTTDEIIAVLAHEVGHFKCNHLKKGVAMMSVMSLLGLALLGYLLQQPWFYNGLGVGTPSTYMGLILFALALPVFTFFIHPLTSWFSRKHEFEADAFAAKHAKADDLIQALVKMYKENASTLTPDELYSSFYDSHPSAPIRINHLESLSN